MGHHRWFRNQFPPFFPVLHCPLGLGELQACPFPDVVFPPLPLSALSSSPLSLCLARWFWPVLMNMRHDRIPLQFASLYDRTEVFVWSDCLLDLGTDFLVANMVLYEMCSILRWYLISMACILLWSSAMTSAKFRWSERGICLRSELVTSWI